MYSQQDNDIIRLSDITVTYGAKTILPGVSLTVRRGDFMALTGPNGGGKTTLLRVILKLLHPDRGTVEYLRDGATVKMLPIGYLPQKSNIDVSFPISAGEVIRSGLLRGFSGRGRSAADRREFDRVVKLCGIGGYLDRPVGELSGGQLQRTLLGRAIISRPEVLVLDEPLSYVDKQFERRIYSIMEQLAQTTTIILVSHEMSIISGMANRHILVDHGLHECGAGQHYIPAACDIPDNSHDF